MAVDFNKFKRNVKDWMLQHPDGSVQALMDFCEEAIPSNQFAAYQWLVEQTVDWYQQVLVYRRQESSLMEES